MRTIHKYMLEITDEQRIEVPAYAERLDAQMQNGKLCLWLIVNTDEAKVPCTVYVVGTGHPMPRGIDQQHHCGTVQTAGLVFHIFIVRAPD